MKLKSKVIQGMVICAAPLLLADSAYSFKQIVSSSPQESRKIFRSTGGKQVSALSPSMNIGPTKDGVIIQVKNGLLEDALQQVANHANIQFKIADHLNSHKINVNIRAKNWDSGVDLLLKNFSKVTVWDKSSKIENVLLMGISDAESLAGAGNAPIDNKTARYQKKLRNRKPVARLSVPKLKQLVKVQPGNAIPAHLFGDREIRDYLKLKGIHSPDDWKEAKRGRIVQHIAKRELVRLLYKQQAKSKIN